MKRTFAVLTLPKVDKTCHKKSFFGLIKKSYLSRPVYNMAYEISDFMMDERDYILNEFPFMSSEDEIYINFACLHFLLLAERLHHTEMKEEYTILEHYMMTEQFNILADFVNPHIDSREFGDHFVEMYSNRYKQIKGLLWHHLKLNIQTGKFNKEIEDAMDKGILNLKFNMRSEKILGKLRIYTLAHVSYFWLRG